MSKTSDWLTSELARRKMSAAELSRIMRKDQGMVSRILSGEREPTTETLKSIARAFNMTAKAVFEATGLLPPPNNDSWAENMSFKLSQINESLRPIAEGLIENLLQSQGETIKKIEKLQSRKL